MLDDIRSGRGAICSAYLARIPDQQTKCKILADVIFSDRVLFDPLRVPSEYILRGLTGISLDQKCLAQYVSQTYNSALSTRRRTIPFISVVRWFFLGEEPEKGEDLLNYIAIQGDLWRCCEIIRTHSSMQYEEIWCSMFITRLKNGIDNTDDWDRKMEHTLGRVAPRWRAQLMEEAIRGRCRRAVGVILGCGPIPYSENGTNFSVNQMMMDELWIIPLIIGRFEYKHRLMYAQVILIRLVKLATAEQIGAIIPHLTLLLDSGLDGDAGSKKDVMTLAKLAGREHIEDIANHILDDTWHAEIEKNYM